jgi:DNA-binding transcriptional LysR family regulator
VGKRLVLNDAGRALLPQALGVLEQARGIEQTFSARAANMPVRLRVAASTTIGTYALPEVLARLARSHPLVRVDLQIANTQEVGEAVLAMEVDMGLIEGSSHWQGLEVEPWLRDELVIVASPGPAGRAGAQQAAGRGSAAQGGMAAARGGLWHARDGRACAAAASAPVACGRHAGQLRGDCALCRAGAGHQPSVARAGAVTAAGSGAGDSAHHLAAHVAQLLVQRAGKRRSPALQAFVDACKAGEPSTAQAPNTL